jgi:hypothetical protein
MTQHSPSAAAALYPRLRSQVPQPHRGRHPPSTSTVAASMYPRLVKPAAKSQAQITPADLRAWAEYIRKMP